MSPTDIGIDSPIAIAAAFLTTMSEEEPLLLPTFVPAIAPTRGDEVLAAANTGDGVSS